MSEKGKFAIVYNDPRLQMERFDYIEESQTRFDELANTAVENLMFVVIIEEITK